MEICSQKNIPGYLVTMDLEKVDSLGHDFLNFLFTAYKVDLTLFLKDISSVKMLVKFFKEFSEWFLNYDQILQNAKLVV